MAERTKMNECWSCVHKRSIAGNAHIACAEPDPKMKGNPHGLISGWFMYPINFDPCWKEVDCNNYKAKSNV